MTTKHAPLRRETHINDRSNLTTYHLSDLSFSGIPEAEVKRRTVEYLILVALILIVIGIATGVIDLGPTYQHTLRR